MMWWHYPLGILIGLWFLALIYLPRGKRER